MTSCIRPVSRLAVTNLASSQLLTTGQCTRPGVRQCIGDLALIENRRIDHDRLVVVQEGCAGLTIFSGTVAYQ